MVVRVWKLDLQLPVQSVPITTKAASLNPDHDEVYSIQHYVIKFVRSMVFSGYSGFLHHDITEILLKLAINTITLPVNIILTN